MSAVPESAATGGSTSEAVEIKVDGAALSGTIFRPAVPPRSAILLHGATGVAHVYYRHFATFAAKQGHLCLTYDYSDFGASASGHPRQSPATMADWGVRDQTAALAHLQREAGSLPVRVIGHSLGGFMIPFHEEIGSVSHITTIASGPAYWREHPWRFMPAVIGFWFTIGPLMAAIAGYMPGKAIGLGADLPAGVYWQWRRWCISADFYRGDIGSVLPQANFERYRGPIRIFSIEDDVMIPPRTVARLDEFYPAAQIERAMLSPRDFGLKRIGHLGAFARSSAPLWETILG